jgi:hypothetical protein
LSTFAGWTIAGAASGLIPLVFAARYTASSDPGQPAYALALKTLVLIGAMTGVWACLIAGLAGIGRSALRGAIAYGALMGTLMTIAVNSYVSWQHSQASTGTLQLPPAVWFILPAIVLLSVTVAAVRGR